MHKMSENQYNTKQTPKNRRSTENTSAARNYYYYLKHESNNKNALFTPSILIFSLYWCVIQEL